jgi:hypothetical protein
MTRKENLGKPRDKRGRVRKHGLVLRLPPFLWVVGWCLLCQARDVLAGNLLASLMKGSHSFTCKASVVTSSACLNFRICPTHASPRRPSAVTRQSKSLEIDDAGSVLRAETSAKRRKPQPPVVGPPIVYMLSTADIESDLAMLIRPKRQHVPQRRYE